MPTTSSLLEEGLRGLSLESTIDRIQYSIEAFQNEQAKSDIRLSFSVESYQSGALSLEAFTDTLKEYWKKFIEFLKKIWTKIKEFFENNFTMIGRRRKEILAISERVKEIEDSSFIRKIREESSTFAIPKGCESAFKLERSVCINYTMLSQALKSTQSGYEFITNDYASHIAQRAQAISHAIESATIENSKEILDELVGTLVQRDLKDEYYPILGNNVIEYTKSTKIENISDLKAMKAVLKSVGRESDSNSKFKTMEPRELIEILASMVRTIDQFETFRKTKFADILQTQSKLVSVTDKYVNKLESFFKGKQGAESSTTLYRGIMDLNSVYLDWIKTPVMETLRAMYSSFSKIARTCDENLSLYSLTQGAGLFNAIASPKLLPPDHNVGLVSNGHIFDLVTEDPALSITGGACTLLFTADMKKNVEHHLTYLTEQTQGDYSNSKSLYTDLKALSALAPNTPLIIICKKLKDQLTPAEYKAIRAHEIGHNFNKDTTEHREDDSVSLNAMETRADAYALRDNSPAVLMSGIEKALAFSAHSSVIAVKDAFRSSKDNIFSGAKNDKIGIIGKTLLNSKLLSKAGAALFNRATKKAHKQRFDTLRRLIKEEAASKAKS